MTTPEALSDQIKQLQQNLYESRARLEALAQQFGTNAAAYIPDVLPRLVEQLVTRYPDIVARAGKEKLATLKAGIKELSGRIGDDVRKALLQDRFWVHRGKRIPTDLDVWAYDGEHYESGINSSSGRYPGSESHNTRSIHSELRRQVEKLLPLLEATGFSFDTDRDWRRQYGNQVGFSGSLVWSPQMVATMNEYGAEARRFVAQQARLESLSTEKRKLEAKQMWDSA